MGGAGSEETTTSFLQHNTHPLPPRLHTQSLYSQISIMMRAATYCPLVKYTNDKHRGKSEDGWVVGVWGGGRLEIASHSLYTIIVLF